MTSWDNFRDNVFVINLDQDIHKLRDVTYRFNKEGIKLNRIPGTYGKTMSNAKRYQSSTFMCNFFCTDTMIGIGDSHIRIWKKIVEENIPYALILEDDTIPTENFIEKFNEEYKNVPDNWDILYLYSHGLGLPDDHSSTLSYIAGGKKVKGNVFVPKFPLSAAAYMISLKGAKKMLELSQGLVEYHIDFQMASIAALSSINIYAIYPFLIVTDLSETTTSTGNSFIANMLTLKPEESFPTYSWMIQEQVFRLPILGWNINVWAFVMIIMFLLLGKTYEWTLEQQIKYSIIFLSLDNILGTNGVSVGHKEILFHIAIMYAIYRLIL